MKLLITLFCIIAPILFFTECKKYPEGPSLSLKSKNARIANTWKLGKYLENDVDLTSDFNKVYTKFVFTTSKDGNYSLLREINTIIGAFSTTETGTWALASDKKLFVILPKTITSGTLPTSSTWEILKLYEKEFWIRNFDSNGKKIEYHLVP